MKKPANELWFSVTVHNAMTTTSRVEFLSDKEKRLSHETVTSPYAPSKPPSRSEIVGENLNGSNSGTAFSNM